MKKGRELTDTPRTGRYRKTGTEPGPNKSAEIISNTFFQKIIFCFILIRNAFMKVKTYGKFLMNVQSLVTRRLLARKNVQVPVQITYRFQSRKGFGLSKA